MIRAVRFVQFVDGDLRQAFEAEGWRVDEELSAGLKARCAEQGCRIMTKPGDAMALRVEAQAIEAAWRGISHYRGIEFGRDKG